MTGPHYGLKISLSKEINAAKENGTKYEDEEGEEEEEEELQDVDDDFLPPLTLHTQQR